MKSPLVVYIFSNVINHGHNNVAYYMAKSFHAKKQFQSSFSVIQKVESKVCVPVLFDLSKSNKILCIASDLSFFSQQV